MKKLTLDTFLSSATDYEMSQYQLLGTLKNYSEQLHKNKVYPALSELIEMEELLDGIIKEKTKLEIIFPQLTPNTSLAKEKDFPDDSAIANDVNQVFDFVNWAHPQILEIITEGKAIYSFVKQNIQIEEIGLIPLYKNEGYFFITNQKNDSEQIYRYEIPFISLDTNSSSLMRVSLIQSLWKNDVEQESLSSIKLNLIKEYDTLPNPATFNMVCDLDFPFEETILPIAKRRLAKKLAV
ncbi:MAG: hypothetical protein NTX22_09640 [Ignavibacteriales bacterium]|nr:hypothetical protein [Ignavibacteriales bacterium]